MPPDPDSESDPNQDPCRRWTDGTITITVVAVEEEEKEDKGKNRRQKYVQ